MAARKKTSKRLATQAGKILSAKPPAGGWLLYGPITPTGNGGDLIMAVEWKLLKSFAASVLSQYEHEQGEKKSKK